MSLRVPDGDGLERFGEAVVVLDEGGADRLVTFHGVDEPDVVSVAWAPAA